MELADLLANHMSHEEAFQATVAKSLQDTAVALATLAARHESARETQEEIRAGVTNLKVAINDHEKRLAAVERSWAQAAGLAKWFFGGGLLATLSLAYAVLKLIDPIKNALEALRK